MLAIRRLASRRLIATDQLAKAAVVAIRSCTARVGGVVAFEARAAVLLAAPEMPENAEADDDELFCSRDGQTFHKH